MKVTKILETRIDIVDINYMFCADYNSVLLNILREKYNRKCFKSIFILNVEKILRRGQLLCKNKTLDGTVYVDVQFEVEGIVYEKNEVIHNCKIVQIHDNGIMHGKTKYAAVQIKNAGINIFSVGEEIPIIVIMDRYSLFANEISVSAIPLIPVVKPPIAYKIKKEKEVKLNYSEVDQLEKELINLSKKKSTSYAFFKKMLYPFKEVKKYSYEKRSIRDLGKLPNNSIVIRPDLYLDDDSIFIINDAESTPVVELSDELLQTIIYEYQKGVTQLIDFINTYDTPEKVKSKSHIWKMYMSLKT